MRLVPFISQTNGRPSVFCQMMSALPSPLKSLVPITCQDEPELGSTPPPIIDVPFNSPVPITCHEGPELGSAPAPIRLVLFISQMNGKPSVFCQMMSALPSPL